MPDGLSPIQDTQTQTSNNEETIKKTLISKIDIYINHLNKVILKEYPDITQLDALSTESPLRLARDKLVLVAKMKETLENKNPLNELRQYLDTNKNEIIKHRDVTFIGFFKDFYAACEAYFSGKTYDDVDSTLKFSSAMRAARGERFIDDVEKELTTKGLD